MQILTVITPTYNRADLLKRLYCSLKQQTNRNFIWLVVDDGSQDDTKAVVAALKEQAPFPVIYVYKENRGKHTALNIGIPKITTPLTMIVDSDDELLPDAVAEIETAYDRYRENSAIGCLCFLRCFRDGKPVVPLEKEEFVDSYIAYRIKGNRPGDMAEVFYTEVLKKYPFPEFKNEKFLSEDVVWIEIGKQFEFAFINKPIYRCEYLSGGLSANDKKMKFDSPQGSMLRGKRLMSRECGFVNNIKGAILYNCYRTRGTVDKRLQCHGAGQIFLLWVTKPLGLLFRMHWKKQI